MRRYAALSLLVLAAATVPAQDVRVIVPYLGAATNVYEKTDPYYTLDWKDTKIMEGLFFQWINPELFLANVFFYHSADINYAQLWGGHLIGDFYLWSNPLGKAAAGAGLEIIRLDTDAGDAESAQGLFDLKLPLTIYAPFARAGHYFYFGSRDRVLLSVFPWGGLQYEVSRGRVTATVDPPGPPPASSVDESTDDETLYGIAGLNLSVTILHFIELQGKYKSTFNGDDFLSTADALANLYFSRHWGLSYRFKYMQNTSGSTSYHIGGLAFVF